MATTTLVSVADWDRLAVPEGYRAEVVAGELVVSPSGPPSHGTVISAVITTLRIAAPADLVVLCDTEWRITRVSMVAFAAIPDVMVVRAADIASDQTLTALPILAVEVLSNSAFKSLDRDERKRIVAKRQDYAANELRDYLEAPEDLLLQR